MVKSGLNGEVCGEVEDFGQILPKDEIDPILPSEMDFYQLINLLITDIQRLESKVVHLRYSLSSFLSEHDREMLRCEILSDLNGSYHEQSAYQQYVSFYCDGHDPMDDESFNNHLLKLSLGKESDL